MTMSVVTLILILINDNGIHHIQQQALSSALKFKLGRF